MTNNHDNWWVDQVTEPGQSVDGQSVAGDEQEGGNARRVTMATRAFLPWNTPHVNNI